MRSLFRNDIRSALAQSVVAPALALVAMLPAALSNASTGTAIKFGVHEIALTGDASVANPFDTVATVKFVPPSSEKNAKTIHAFFDGDNTWRARVYVSEIGGWSCSSACATDKGPDGKTGTFRSGDSKLRGRLLPHPKNPRYWITEDGRWFLHVGDTAYYLLSSYDESVAGVMPELPLPHVMVDHAEVGRMAARHFVERGVRHFGFVGYPQHAFSVGRERGFREVVESVGFTVAVFHERQQRIQERARHYGDCLPLASASLISFSSAVSMAFSPGAPTHLCRITPWGSRM